MSVSAPTTLDPVMWVNSAREIGPPTQKKDEIQGYIFWLAFLYSSYFKSISFLVEVKE